MDSFLSSSVGRRGNNRVHLLLDSQYPLLTGSVTAVTNGLPGSKGHRAISRNATDIFPFCETDNLSGMTLWSTKSSSPPHTCYIVFAYAFAPHVCVMCLCLSAASLPPTTVQLCRKFNGVRDMGEWPRQLSKCNCGRSIYAFCEACRVRSSWSLLTGVHFASRNTAVARVVVAR